jgi:hypothetical protein
MAVQLSDIQHDGGTHEVSVETERDQCVIKFGGSFTLRVDEKNLNKLREMIHVAARDITIERRDTTDLNGKSFLVSEDDFIDAGISAREQSKSAKHAAWNPNDPSNW